MGGRFGLYCYCVLLLAMELDWVYPGYIRDMYNGQVTSIKGPGVRSIFNKGIE